MDLVPDANTLIYLAKADLLELLEDHDTWVNGKIYRETVVKGKEKGFSDSFILEKHIEEKINRIQIDQERFENEKDYFGAPGETEVYIIASSKDCTAVTSDQAALNKMKRKNVETIRTDMLLLKNFKQERISQRELREKLGKLRTVNGTTESRMNFILQKSDEIQ